MLLHGGSILDQAHHVTKLVVATMTGSVRSAGKHYRTVTSTRAKAPSWGAFTFHLLPIGSSIAGKTRHCVILGHACSKNLPCGESAISCKVSRVARVQRTVYKVLAFVLVVWRTTHFSASTFRSGGWSLRPQASSAQFLLPLKFQRGVMVRRTRVFGKGTPYPAGINRSIDCPPYALIFHFFFTLIPTRFARVRG